MKYKNYSMRYCFQNCNTPEKFKGTVEFCKETGINELLICLVLLGEEPIFLDRAGIVKRCEEFKKTREAFAKENIEANILVLRTFFPEYFDVYGHYNTEHKQARIDINRKTQKNVPCPLDKSYWDYINFMYREYAKTGAKKIWVDDDFRYDRIATLSSTCFCPLHIDEFNKRYSTNVTFEQLVQACNNAECSELKVKWMAFKRQLYIEFAAGLRETVHSVNPDCRIGLMLTAPQLYANDARDNNELLRAFSGELRPMARPGFGWYQDFDRTQFTQSIAMVNQQASELDNDVEIQPEMDLFPHTMGFNTANNCGLEFRIAAYLALNFKKIDIWPFNADHDVNAAHPYTKIISKNEKYFEAIAALIPPEARQIGISTPYNIKKAYVNAATDGSGNMGSVYNMQQSAMLWRAGLPYTFLDSDTVYLTPESFPINSEELAELIETKNVFLDAGALSQIAHDGNEHILGLKIEKIPKSRAEHFSLTSHDLNGKYKQREYQKVTTRDLQIVEHDSYEVLGKIKLNEIESAGLLVRENNGKRSVIANVNYDYRNINFIDQYHLHKIFDWLSHGAVPVMVSNYPDLCPSVFKAPGAEDLYISLMNVSLGYAEEATLDIAWTENTAKIIYLNEQGEKVFLPQECISRKHNKLEVNFPEGLRIYPFQLLMMKVLEK